jgi:branched-chain amino acid transport system ATP-binding protein
MLEVVSATVSYGPHRALENVSIHVAKGEICVILGANGAGKSTLLKTIAGMVRAAPGIRATMNGRVISGMKPHEIVEEGVALVPEGRGVFGELTVAENLRLGAYAHRARRDEAESLERILSLFPRLAERRAQMVRTMSGGEQQMVAIGRALMSKPDILMLDEPSLGLSPRLTSELFKSLQRIGATGMGILLVEQNARQSLAIADRGYLLENGHIVGENGAATLLNDPAVQQAYLGGAAAKVPTLTRTVAAHAPAVPVAHSAEPHVAPAIPAMPPAGTDAASIASGIGDLVARAAASQADFVRDGGARAGASHVPPANGFHPTAERDVQSIIAEMEAAARRARLIGDAEAKLPPAKSQLTRKGADAAQRSGGD